MNPRLVGAAIIVAVASIVLPLLFQNPVKHPDKPDFVIPPEPAISNLPSAKVPEQYEVLGKRLAEIASEDQEIANPIESPNTAIETDKSAKEEEAFSLDADKLPVAWTIQLATFKNYDNAAALREKLRTAGYKVYTRRSSNSSGELVKVLVGPVVRRTEVEKLKEELSKRYKLEGMITRYMR